jgi:uncharacterized coiled-coil DUF342 family protein
MTEANPVLLEMMKQLRDDFREEREASRTSRAQLHKRMDEVAEDVGTIRGDIRILGQVDGQVREELQEVKASLQNHKDAVDPTVQGWNELMRTGKRVSWVFGIAGISTIGGLLGVVTGVYEWIGRLVFRQ